MVPLNLEPLNGNIFVADEGKVEKIGNIYIPDNSGGDSIIVGNVIKTSCFLLESGNYQESGLHEGDRVIYNQHAGAGNVFVEDKKTYRLVRFNEILARVVRE